MNFFCDLLYLTKDFFIDSKYFAPILFFNVKAILFKDEVHKIVQLVCINIKV